MVDRESRDGVTIKGELRVSGREEVFLMVAVIT